MSHEGFRVHNDVGLAVTTFLAGRAVTVVTSPSFFLGVLLKGAFPMITCHVSKCSSEGSVG